MRAGIIRKEQSENLKLKVKGGWEDQVVKVASVTSVFDVDEIYLVSLFCYIIAKFEVFMQNKLPLV